MNHDVVIRRFVTSLGVSKGGGIMFFFLNVHQLIHQHHENPVVQYSVLMSSRGTHRKYFDNMYEKASASVYKGVSPSCLTVVSEVTP